MSQNAPGQGEDGSAPVVVDGKLKCRRCAGKGKYEATGMPGHVVLCTWCLGTGDPQPGDDR